MIEYFVRAFEGYRWFPNPYSFQAKSDSAALKKLKDDFAIPFEIGTEDFCQLLQFHGIARIFRKETEVRVVEKEVVIYP